MARDARSEAYLRALRVGLRGLDDDVAAEIVEEIRGHLRETGGAWDELGPPDVLAARYRGALLAGDPPRGMVTRWLRRVGLAALGLAGAAIGYGLAAAWGICALVKPVSPGRVGLWKLADPADDWSFSLGAVDAVGARELLGWWMIPVGLALGLGLAWMTTRFARWSVRALRDA